MKKSLAFVTLPLIIALCLYIPVQGQTRIVKKGAKYDTIIVKHGPKPAKKPIVKPAVIPAVIQEIVLPIPEFINQPYYFDKEGNKLIKLENANALMITKKKTLGLKGAKQFLSMDATLPKYASLQKRILFFLLKPVVM